MSKLFPSLMAAVVSLHAASASAQTEEIQAKQVGDESSANVKASGKAGEKALDQGWNADWALLFSFNNILVNGNFLSGPITGSVGATYFLSDMTALRAGFTVNRQHNAVQVTKNIVTTGDVETTTYTVSPPGYTAFHSISLNADYIMRLMRTEIAPYAGAGVYGSWSWTRLNYLDEESVVNQRTEVDNNSSGLSLGVKGILGAEWRLHENFAFFAEYSVWVTAWSKNRLRNRTTVENTAGELVSTNQTENQRDYSTWFNISSGLAQGGSLGLEVLF